MKNLTTLFLTAAIALSSLAIATPADAALKLRITDLDAPGSTVTIEDQSALDSIAAEGSVNHFFSNTNWSVVVSTVFSKPLASLPELMHLNVAVFSNNAGRIKVEATDTNFGAFDTPSIFMTDISINGATVDASTHINTSNIEFDITGAGAKQLHQYNGGSGFDIKATYADAGSPFSLTMSTVITHVTAGATSFDYEARIPEPTSIALMGLGLLSIGLLSARRKNRV